MLRFVLCITLFVLPALVFGQMGNQGSFGSKPYGGTGGFNSGGFGGTSGSSHESSLLMETGDYLLLETSDTILME